MVNWKLKLQKPKKPFLTASVAVVLGLAIAWGYMAAKEAYFNHFSEPVAVFVASGDILEGTRLDESHVAVQKVPRRFMQPGAIQEPQSLMGMISRVPILKGEQFLGTKLMGLGKKSGLAHQIPEGFRALSVEVDEASGVGGLIRPGNRVDLVGTFEMEMLGETQAVTLTLSQNVLVLAVNQEMDDGPKLYRPDLEEKGFFGGKGDSDTAIGFGKKTVTLALQPQAVQNVKFAAEQGSLSMSLRPQREEETRTLTATTAFSVTGVKANVSKNFKEYRGR